MPRMHRESILGAVPCDVRELPLGAVEAFVLSRIDGRATLEELADLVGMELQNVTRVASRLLEVGAVVLLNGPHANAPNAPNAPNARATKKPARRSSAPPGGKIGAGKTGAGGSTRSSRPAQAAVRPSDRVARDADEACDLSGEVRARLLELDERLDALDYYALLGVARDASSKAIKRAYYALAAQYHPDRFFGKKLGPLRAPLERVFVSMTRAHDTLVDRVQRARYDSMLPPDLPPSSVVSKVPHSDAGPAPAPDAPSTPPARTTPPRTPPPARLPSRRMPAVVAKSKPPPRPPSRRVRALGTVASSQPAPPRDAKAIASHGLKRLYAETLSGAQTRRASLFLRAAEEAIAKDDVVAAANHYRLALQIAEDPATRALLEQLDTKAKARTYEASVARAKSEEQALHWDTAAAAFERAYGVKAEPWLAERVANALRRAGRDLRRAAQLGEQAVLAEPRNMAYRVTLAEVYLAAGLLARAAGEAERALSIAPADPRAKAVAAAVNKAKGAKE